MNLSEIQKSLPENLVEVVSDCAWRQIHLGLSPSQVFRLESENKKSLYLKISSRFPGFSLLQEKLKLEWLENRLPVPKVLLFVEDESVDYLLLSEISGNPASDDSLKSDIPRIIEQLAEGLKLIHGLPIENCPFDERLAYKIEIAQERFVKGLVDASEFDDERQGKTIENLARNLFETKPLDEDLVFTHGDYCVPNVILKDGKLNGFVDWGNAGVADRYQDIAILTRSICYNFGDEWQEYLLEIYGIKPDWKKIHFYRLLDEFF